MRVDPVNVGLIREITSADERRLRRPDVTSDPPPPRFVTGIVRSLVGPGLVRPSCPAPTTTPHSDPSPSPGPGSRSHTSSPTIRQAGANSVQHGLEPDGHKSEVGGEKRVQVGASSAPGVRQDSEGKDGGGGGQGPDVDFDPMWGDPAENSARLEALLRSAYRVETEVIGCGLTVDEDGVFALYYCVRPPARRPIHRRKKRARVTLVPVDQSMWVLSGWRALDEVSDPPADEFDEWSIEPAPIEGLSVGGRPFELDPDSCSFFHAVAMHCGVHMFHSNASPTLAVAFRSDAFQDDQCVQRLLAGFATKVGEEEPHRHDAHSSFPIDEPPMRFDHLSWGSDRGGRASNFRIEGRGMASLGGSWTVWLMENKPDGSFAWHPERHFGGNISSAFPLWALHRVGIRAAHNHLHCGLTTVYLDWPGKGGGDAEYARRTATYDAAFHRQIHNLRRGSGKEEDEEDEDHCPLLADQHASSLSRRRSEIARRVNGT